MGPAPASCTCTNQSKQRFQPNLPGSELATSSDIGQCHSPCFLSASTTDDSLFPAFSVVVDTLSAFGTLHNQNVQMPYDDSTLADPSTLAYDYVAPSLANHDLFDTPLYIEPNGFVEPSNNSIPCP